MTNKKDTKIKSINLSNFNLSFTEVDTLLDDIEKIKRRKINDFSVPINYIDPFNNVSTLKNPVNHLIIGRRGAGKTSLLIKVIEEIKKTNAITTIVDMQGRQKQSEFLPLVEVLILLYEDLIFALEQDDKWEPVIKRKTKLNYFKLKSIFYGLFSKNMWDIETIKYDKLHFKLTKILNDLQEIKYTPEGAIINFSDSKNETKKSNFGVAFLSNVTAESKYLKELQLSLSSTTNTSYSKEVVTNKLNSLEYEKKYSKQEALNELKSKLTNSITEFYNIFNRNIFLILDDFYQIPIKNQPFIFQYLHDINKETPNMAFSYKACLVPNRFKLNDNENKILSHKDDFSTINLDREFYDIEANQDLLLKILCGINPKLGLNTENIVKLFNDSLILKDCIRVSGALPRYFLDVFSNMVKFSKAENYPKIHQKVFPHVVREMKISKDGLVTEEANLPAKQIKELTNIIEEKVVHDLQTNVILYPDNAFKKNEEILNTLINLGYIHRIKENVIVGKKNYIPIFIDMIFTHTKSNKMPKNFKDFKFWTPQGRKLTQCKIWEFPADIINPIAEVL